MLGHQSKHCSVDYQPLAMLACVPFVASSPVSIQANMYMLYLMLHGNHSRSRGDCKCHMMAALCYSARWKIGECSACSVRPERKLLFSSRSSTLQVRKMQEHDRRAHSQRCNVTYRKPGRDLPGSNSGVSLFYPAHFVQ